MTGSIHHLDSAFLLVPMPGPGDLVADRDAGPVEAVDGIEESGPSLITNYDAGTPTGYGAGYRAHLRSLKPGAVIFRACSGPSALLPMPPAGAATDRFLLAIPASYPARCLP